MSMASKKRRELGFYLDFLLFGAVWATLAWSLRAYVPALSAWYAMGLAFALFELAFTLALGVAPHAYVLGLRKEGRSLVVEPRWLERERVWTMVVGTCTILEGSKEATRSLQGLPPPPFMGLDLSPSQATAIVTITGWLVLLIGIGILRCRTRAALAGITLAGISFISSLLSWDQLPAWIEARSIARHVARGATAQAGEGAMQAGLPGVMVFGACAAAVVCFVMWRHFQACDRRAAFESNQPAKELFP